MSSIVTIFDRLGACMNERAMDDSRHQIVVQIVFVNTLRYRNKFNASQTTETTEPHKNRTEHIVSNNIHDTINFNHILRLNTSIGMEDLPSCITEQDRDLRLQL